VPLVRELRASARRTDERGRSLADVHLLVLRRTVARAASSDAAKRARELERFSLALAAHDPERTLARGYALVQDRAGEPLGSAAAARAAGELVLRFHDGAVPAKVVEG
jgi:exodeoxyribonuclease VII large subunit